MEIKRTIGCMICDCGNPTTFKQGGYPICSRCRELQRIQLMNELRRHRIGRKPVIDSRGKLYLYDPHIKPFRAFIRELANGFEIHGHGVYRVGV